MEEKISDIKEQLLAVYNRIAVRKIDSAETNLFEPNTFTNPLDMVYFLDEIEGAFNISFTSEDISFDCFCNITKIAEIVDKKRLKKVVSR